MPNIPIYFPPITSVKILYLVLHVCGLGETTKHGGLIVQS